MWRSGLISSLALVLVLSVYACSVDTTPDPGAVSEADEAPLEIPSELVLPDAAALTGCGRLNWCDKKDDPIGTDCTQLAKSGCTFAKAAADCMSLLASASCNYHCVPVMRNASGTITYRGFSCGGRCCPYGSQYCGPGGACCDGVHFNAACPPL